MIQTTLNGKNVLIVDVPEGATGFELWKQYHINGKYKLPGIGYNHPDTEITWEEQELPPGSWSIVGPGLCSDVTEEEARNIVEWYGKGDGSIDEAGVGDTFMCYDDSDFCFDTGIESIHSFIRSNGKEPSKCVLLINQNSKS